jgi:hypothetical protein
MRWSLGMSVHEGLWLGDGRILLSNLDPEMTTPQVVWHSHLHVALIGNFTLFCDKSFL